MEKVRGTFHHQFNDSDVIEPIFDILLMLHREILLMCQATGNSEILKLRKMLEDETHQKEKLEGEIATLHSQLLQLSFDADEVCCM